MYMRNALNTPARLPLLSQTAEHALRAVLYLGRRPDGSFTSAQEIAEALGAPSNYMSKTLRVLARHGILRSVRGPSGGFTLAVSPEALTPARIVEAVDDVRVPAMCLMGTRPCHPGRPCAVHARWDELRSRVLGPLEDTTIADLLADADSSSIAVPNSR